MTPMMQHLPDATPAIVMFLIYAFYLVARAVWFTFRRELYHEGYRDGVYSGVSKYAKLKYHPDINLVECDLSEDVVYQSSGDAYQRYVKGE